MFETIKSLIATRGVQLLARAATYGASALAGKLGVQETFNVNLGQWYEYSEDVKYGQRSNELDALIRKGLAKVDKEENKTWVRPEPISIRQMIQKDMYAIMPNASRWYSRIGCFWP